MKGVGPANDVWALGCLLFELLTGEILQFDTDWARFYTRVTQDKIPLIDNDKIKSDSQHVICFLMDIPGYWTPATDLT